MKVLLVVYDNGSHIHWFPQGLSYIAAVLSRAGHDVEIYSQDKYHYPDEHLTQYLDKNRFDVIGVSVIAGYYQYRKLLAISEAINRSKKRPFYMLGGHGPAPEPEFFLNKTQADVIVMGEGEETVIELMKALSGRTSLRDIKGIAFREEDRVIANEKRPLIKDVDSIPFPAFELFPIEYYRLLRMPHMSASDFLMTVISGRGCPFKCTFCYRMDEGFRPRSSESIIDEIRLLKERYMVNYILFQDELLMSSEARTARLCEDMIKAGLRIKWHCNGRLNYAKPKVLKLMKEAGCVFVNYGIESMDDEVLKNMRKALTTDQIVKGVEATIASGITPGLNIIFGNLGDNRRTLEKSVKFLLKYGHVDQMRTIRPVTPYPGSELYRYAIKKKLLKDCEDFYENKHINSDLLSINFTEMSDDDFHRCLLDANTRLIGDYFSKKQAVVIDQAKKLYLEKDASFRGFRQV
ncbi:MAG: radical SAM protein [Candidatus Omnitrophota bacterium]